jgi:hypothetical protein
MKRHLFYLALVALTVLTVGTSGSLAAQRSGTIGYVFNGQLLADAGSSSSLFVDVRGGNRPALRKLIGQGRTQQFAVGPSTQYIRWTNGVPAVVDESSLVAGDHVTVRVRAARDASLAQIESTPAWRVADRGANNGHPSRPLWLFIGTLNGPAAGGHFSLHIRNGNLRALRAMLGQPLDQGFTYDSHTIFVLWQHGVPSVIQPAQMVVGDRISVRIRARGNSSLGQVESTPANHVGDHEPGA